MIGLFLLLSLNFSQRKGLSPGIIFEYRASLGNYSYIPVSNSRSVFAVDTSCRHHRFTLERHMLFFYPLRLTELFPFPVHSTITDIYIYIFLPHMYFLYLFLSFNKELFQLLNFTFSCTYIDSLYQGSFPRSTCQNNSRRSVAGKLQDPSTVVSFYMRFPE